MKEILPIGHSDYYLFKTSVKKTLVFEKSYTENYVLQHEFGKMQGNVVHFGIKMLKMNFVAEMEVEKRLF